MRVYLSPSDAEFGEARSQLLQTVAVLKPLKLGRKQRFCGCGKRQGGLDYRRVNQTGSLEAGCACFEGVLTQMLKNRTWLA